MEKLNLYQKLLHIQTKINGLGKDKSTYNYKYVTGDKVLGEIKPLMNQLNLILKQEVVSIENTRQDYLTKSGSKSEVLSKVMMQFTWIDCATGEKDVNSFGANGQNDWEKGLGSALTYAERYFLLKYFHIATDEDDIDNDQRKTTAPVPIKPIEERIKDAMALLSDVNSEQQMIDIYKSLSTDLKNNQTIINLCAEIRLHYNPKNTETQSNN
jgi:hypothetical protein